MSISLTSIGDVMLGENVHHFQRGIIKKFKNNYASLIQKEVKDSFKDSDIVLINLESSLAPDDFFKTRNIKNGVYVAPEESIGLIKELNNTIIANIANNHFSQHGIESADYTVKKLEQAGIQLIGKDNKPLTVVKKGICLKMWGVSLINDNHSCGAYFKSTYETLLQDIYVEPKLENEYRIISIHWGEEYYTKESEKQRTLAKQLSKEGFDLILGHHPHVIQPVDKIGDTIVIYSHGNFIFDQNFSKLTQKGLVCRFSLPDNEPKYLFSQQKDFKVASIVSINQEKLIAYCKNEYDIKKPLIMRMKMKIELFMHFYELNYSIIRIFFFRFLQK